MAQMIDFDKIAADARRNAGVIGAPTFNIGMGGFSKADRGTPLAYGTAGNGLVYNTENYDTLSAEERQARPFSIGGAERSYVPEQDQFRSALVPETTYGLEPPAMEQPVEATAPVQEPVQGGVDEQQNAIEQVAQYGDIPKLLEALKAMASMEPGQGNPVFQLDAAYKGSSALGGLPGTVAQYPTAGGMTRETDYSL